MTRKNAPISGWDDTPISGKDILDDVLRAKQTIERQIGINNDELDLVFCPEDNKPHKMFGTGPECYSQGMIVTIFPQTDYYDPPHAEPEMDLRQLQELMKAISNTFPNGWEIKEGKIVSKGGDKT